MPHGTRQRPACVRRHRPGRDGHHHRPPLGDGQGFADQPAHGRCRRARGRLVAGAGSSRPPGDEPASATRTPMARAACAILRPMRQLGAAARHMLEQAAAKQWGVDVARGRGRKSRGGAIKAQAEAGLWRAGHRRHASCRCPPGAAEAQGPRHLPLHRQGRIPIVDLDDITTGKAVYGFDIAPAGMKFAVIAHPPVVGGKVKSVRRAEALKVPGVEKVVADPPASMPPAKFQPLGGVAVVASNTWAATQGRERLRSSGTTARTRLTIRSPIRRPLEEATRTSRARSSATRATPRRRWPRPPR